MSKRPVRFDLDPSGFAGEVMAEAGPWPVFGFFDEAALDRIAVDVAELFDLLACGDDVEVVVASVPEGTGVVLEPLGGFALQNAECVGEGLPLWFADQQMDVLRHQDVAKDEELVSSADQFEGFFEGCTGFVVGEVGLTLMTAEGDEVMMTFGLVSLQVARHEGYGSSGVHVEGWWQDVRVVVFASHVFT
jgi:hypothetical protein